LIEYENPNPWEIQVKLIKLFKYDPSFD